MPRSCVRVQRATPQATTIAMDTISTVKVSDRITNDNDVNDHSDNDDRHRPTSKCQPQTYLDCAKCQSVIANQKS